MRKYAVRALFVMALGLAVTPGARADSSLGSWTAVAPMSTPRLGAVAAALPDGEILVAGGEDAQGNVLSSAELYDPATNSWSPTAAMSTARMYAAAVPVNGEILVAGGQDGSGTTLASAEMFDPTTGSWSPAAAMPFPRTMGSGVVTTYGTAIIAGGQGDPNDSSQAVTFEPDADEWGYYDFGPSNLVGAAMAPSDNGSVLEAGGADTTDGVVEPNLVSWSPGQTGTGMPMAAMATARFLATATQLPANRILVAGGSADTAGDQALSSAEIFDQQAGTWSAAAAMPQPAYGAASVMLASGQALVIGGSDGTSATAAVEEFTAPALPVPQVGGQTIYDTTSQPVGTTQYVYVGDELQGGGWATGSDTTVQIGWQRCRGSVCTDIPGTTTATYTPTDYTVTDADVGFSLRAVITGSNAYGSSTKATPELGPVQAPGYHVDPGLIPLAGLPGTAFQGIGPFFDPSRIAVSRDDTTGAGHVQYLIWQPGSVPHPSFTPLSGTLSFAPGQSWATVNVPALDHGVPILAPELEISLYDSSPLPIGTPGSLIEPVTGVPLSDYTRAPRNPLALSRTPPSADPLRGARFFVDHTGTAVAHAAQALQATHPQEAALLDEIVEQPDVTRFGTWSGNYPGQAVQSFLERAQQQEPGTIPMLATYKIVNSHLTHPECHHWADPPATQAEYHEWITNLAEGIGAQPAVLFLEMDSLITVGCLSHEGLQIRLHELHDAINVLQADPHLVVYLDAGAADAAPAAKMAHLLREAGIAHIQGFFLNSTHFDWTNKEIRYGEEISRLTGGKHFVINTAENGQGPLIPKDRAKDGNEVLCNPPGRGLGPLPTADTGYRNVDAFAWIANPGVSGGICGPGQPAGGVFSTALALGLVRHADFKVR